MPRGVLWKGLVAGAVAGLVATAAKTAAEKLYPPRIYGEPEPPEEFADKLAGHELEGEQKLLASEAVHWSFGASAGAAYGAVAEFYPAATSKHGASFGLVLMSLTHESALPMMGLSAPPSGQSARERRSEMATHLVFGVVTEAIRSFVRKRLE
ncbi:MAG: DUF1440 domain-containing protein [Acidobacteriaceae bacterium]|nr:DUF1440 domain-containing protein [Acidobacteriaceae bacterium]